MVAASPAGGGRVLVRASVLNMDHQCMTSLRLRLYSQFRFNSLLSLFIPLRYIVPTFKYDYSRNHFCM